MANNTFKEIADVLLRAENILIYPHINADGDAAGSAAALCHGLRSLGKTAYMRGLRRLQQISNSQEQV